MTFSYILTDIFIFLQAPSFCVEHTLPFLIRVVVCRTPAPPAAVFHPFKSLVSCYSFFPLSPTPWSPFTFPVFVVAADEREYKTFVFLGLSYPLNVASQVLDIYMKILLFHFSL